MHEYCSIWVRIAVADLSVWHVFVQLYGMVCDVHINTMWWLCIVQTAKDYQGYKEFI